MGMGLGIPAPGAGALPLGAFLLATGNFSSFGAGGGTVDGSVGIGFGIPVPGAGITPLGLLFGTGPGTFDANLTSTTGGGRPE